MGFKELRREIKVSERLPDHEDREGIKSKGPLSRKKFREGGPFFALQGFAHLTEQCPFLVLSYYYFFAEGCANVCIVLLY
jgi:hypothetical protein